MIDRVARESLAEKLRQLASGAITNFGFEEGYRRSKSDPAIHEISVCLAWPYYDDNTEHRLTGDHALLDGHRKDFARAVLFLKSDCEYRWPKRSGLAGWSGQIRRIFGMPLSSPKRDMGEVRFWPFWSEEEYRDALKQHPYLVGQSPNAQDQI